MNNNATYIIRFDDICPTMNWTKWERIEKILDQYQVKPIMAVIPDNQDNDLMIDQPKNDFWDIIRLYKQKGWTIAIHGHQHLKLTNKGGLMNLNPCSEFAGLTYDKQKESISNAIKLFNKQQLEPTVWVAPFHSYDYITLRILKEFNIQIVSDGFHLYPFVDDALLFIPQQLWNFKKMPFGVWTICLHHNHMSDQEIDRLEQNIQLFKNNLTTLGTLTIEYKDRRKGLSDYISGHLLSTYKKIKK